MEIINELSTLRDELFDAPSDVKASFNRVCQYFAGSNPDSTTKNSLKKLSSDLGLTSSNSEEVTGKSPHMMVYLSGKSNDEASLDKIKENAEKKGYTVIGPNYNSEVGSKVLKIFPKK